MLVSRGFNFVVDFNKGKGCFKFPMTLEMIVLAHKLAHKTPNTSF